MERPSEPPYIPSDSNQRINFFRPRSGFMRSKVRFVWLALGGWAGLTFGFQILLYLRQTDPSGNGPLTTATFLGFPFHYWFTGQFLIVWFILLCFLFNLMVDRLTDRYRTRR